MAKKTKEKEVVKTASENVSNEFVMETEELTMIEKYSQTKVGEISVRPYFSAEMENMGVYGDSLFYKNRFSIRSDEELEIGMQIEVIKHEKRTITSLVKNHPTFLVRVLNKENKEETTND